MHFNLRGLVLAAAATLLTCLAPTPADKTLKWGGYAQAAAAKIADEFRFPFDNGKAGDGKTDTNRWYVSESFGDPRGEACRALKSPVCYNLGEDWKHEKGTLGKPVRAVANGELLDFGYAPTPGGSLPDSLGNYVLIKHTLPAPGRHIPKVGWVRTIVSLYAHLQDLRGICGDDSLSCKVRQPIRIGEPIGHIGNTGATKDASLHLELRLSEETCSLVTAAGVNTSCLKYSKDRYPARYANLGGWVDPSCFIENRRAPKNDDFEDALSIGAGETRKGNNLCATKEAGEPNHAGKRIRRDGRNSGGKSVWWKFVAPKSTQYAASTVGSDFNTVVGAYVVVAGNLAAVAHNDLEKPNLCDAANYCTSRVEFTATAGTTYYIAVDGASADGATAPSGDIQLTVAEADSSLFVSPSGISFEPIYDDNRTAPPPVNYYVSASKEELAYWISNVPAWITPSRTFGRAGQSAQSVKLKVNEAADTLPAGTHTAKIVFGTSQGPQTRNLTLTIIESPTLQVAPTSGIAGSGNEGGPFNPSLFSYAIRTTTGKVSYRISGVPSWLTASSLGGRATKTPTTVTFTVNSNADSLAAGTYNATIKIRNRTNGNGTTTFPAVLTVNALPQLEVSPATAMTASGLQGGPFNPASFPYQIRATSGTLAYAISNVPNWLTVSSSSGTATTTSQIVTFTVNQNANALLVGTHNATINFTNSTNGRGTTSRSVVITVNSPPPSPSLQLSPATAMAASGPQGGPFNPVSFPYQINATTGTLAYAISGVPNWLTVSSTSGTATTTPQTVTFTINQNANALAVGTYNATITFANSTNGQGTTSRSVALTVSAPPTIQYLTDGNGGYLLAEGGQRLAGM